MIDPSRNTILQALLIASLFMGCRETGMPPGPPRPADCHMTIHEEKALNRYRKLIGSKRLATANKMLNLENNNNIKISVNTLKIDKDLLILSATITNFGESPVYMPQINVGYGRGLLGVYLDGLDPNCLNILGRVP